MTNNKNFIEVINKGEIKKGVVVVVVATVVDVLSQIKYLIHIHTNIQNF